jgi:hypothetical protein
LSDCATRAGARLDFRFTPFETAWLFSCSDEAKCAARGRLCGRAAKSPVRHPARASRRSFGECFFLEDSRYLSCANALPTVSSADSAAATPMGFHRCSPVVLTDQAAEKSATAAPAAGRKSLDVLLCGAI